MFDNLKITMLGTTGAGKTCYMLGMYAMMQLGVHGFTLSAKDMDEDLDLTDKWEALVNGEGEDRWPLGTDTPHTYAFDFCYGMKPIMGFEWLDYRGGAMSAKSTSAQDVQVLKNYLLESDCVFLCISGEFLKNPEETGLMALARAAKVNAMNQYMKQLGETIQPNNGKPFPIVIAITKYDLCSHRNKQEIFADVKQLFNPLFTPDSGWLVMVCPVSLGKELAGNMNGGQIEPRNVHLPLAFGIYSKFREYALAEKGLANEFGNRLTSLHNGNWLQKVWRNNDILAAQEALAISQGRLNLIQEKLAILSQELEKAELYLSGEEIEINV